MEHCDFPDLRKFMNQNKKKKLGEGLVASIVYEMLDCLAYLEDKGVCHKDIKPENILYDEVSGKIKLIDFDIAEMQRYKHEKL